MSIQTTVVIFAILAAFGLVTIVAMDIVFTAQEAEAKGCEDGNAASLAFNASKGRCFGHGPN